MATITAQMDSALGKSGLVAGVGFTDKRRNVITIGEPLFYGLMTAEQMALPIRHDIDGEIQKIRIRSRNNKFAMAYVTTPTGVRVFAVKVEPDHIFVPLEFEQTQSKNQ